MTFEFTETQLMIQETARKFAEEELAPTVLERDEKEEFPSEDETQKAISTARKLGIWPEPLKLYRHLSRSGGGLLFRVPADLEKQLKLNEKTEIEITKVGNKIVLNPQIS